MLGMHGLETRPQTAVLLRHVITVQQRLAQLSVVAITTPHFMDVV